MPESATEQCRRHIQQGHCSLRKHNAYDDHCIWHTGTLHVSCRCARWPGGKRSKKRSLASSSKVSDDTHQSKEMCRVQATAVGAVFTSTAMRQDRVHPTNLADQAHTWNHATLCKRLTASKPDRDHNSTAHLAAKSRRSFQKKKERKLSTPQEQGEFPKVGFFPISLVFQSLDEKSTNRQIFRRTSDEKSTNLQCVFPQIDFITSLRTSFAEILHRHFLISIKMGLPTCYDASTATKSSFRQPTQRRKVPRKSTCSSRGFISTSTNSATLQEHPSWRRRSVRRMIDGFATLRSLLPKRCDGETPTKVQTLQMATEYIRDLSSLLKESDGKKLDFDLSDFNETSSQSRFSLLSSDTCLNLFQPSVFDFVDEGRDQTSGALLADHTRVSSNFESLNMVSLVKPLYCEKYCFVDEPSKTWLPTTSSLHLALLMLVESLKKNWKLAMKTFQTFLRKSNSKSQTEKPTLGRFLIRLYSSSSTPVLASAVLLFCARVKGCVKVPFTETIEVSLTVHSNYRYGIEWKERRIRKMRWLSQTIRLSILWLSRCW